jgi:iron complex outermembrane receptor protein
MGRWFLLCATVSLPALAAAATGGAEGADAANRSADELASLSLSELMQMEIPTVVGASKHEQKVTEAPASVTIITADDIKKYGYRTLADIMRSVRGFYVVNTGSYELLGVRGFNRPQDFGGRVLILVDGHRMNDPLYDSAAVGTEFMLDVDLIERVEIVRGPGSALYGDNAVFAVINVITRRGRQMNGPEAAASAGSFDTYTARASYGNLFTNGVEVLVSGSVLDSAGPARLHASNFALDLPGNPVAVHSDDTQTRNMFASVGYHDLSLEGGYVDRYKKDPTAPFGEVFGDGKDVKQDERAFVELKFTREFGDGWQVMARSYYDHYFYAGSYPYNYANPGDPPDIIVNRDEDAADWAGGEVQLSKQLWDAHLLTAGAEYWDDFHIELHNFNIAPPTTFQDLVINRDNFAFYGQDEWRVLTNFIVNAGVRYDHYESFGNAVNPRVALIYNPWTPTTFKFLCGTAFRAPNAIERFYSDGGITSVPSPNLRPEKVTTYELVAEQAIGRNYRATVAGFLTEAYGLIQDTTNVPSYYANLSNVEAKGLEFEVQGFWTNGVRGVLSYTLTDTDNYQTGTRLDDSPTDLAKLNLTAPVWRDKVFTGFEVQYTSDRTTQSGNTVNAFIVANLTLYAHNFWGGWEATGSLYNIFDTKYRDPASGNDSVEQDGREFRVKLTYRF